MSGLTIVTSAHVLNMNGEIIIHVLYAASEFCGDIHAGNRLGGNAIADCFVFGKLPAKT